MRRRSEETEVVVVVKTLGARTTSNGLVSTAQAEITEKAERNKGEAQVSCTIGSCYANGITDSESRSKMRLSCHQWRVSIHQDRHLEGRPSQSLCHNRLGPYLKF